MNYIAKAQGIWFEGSSALLYAIERSLVLLPMAVPEQQSKTEMLFREDYFNSATRIRRGRVYRRDDGQQSWSTQSVRTPLGFLAGTLLNVTCCYTTAECALKPTQLAVLGDGNAQSYWTVVFSEKTSDALYLTLKSKTYFGVLPEVNWEAIPAANRQDIQQALDAVVEAAPIQAPQPVIDACRNAACHMISAKFPESNPKGKKDLGQLASWLEREGHRKKKARKADAEATDALIELPDSYTSYVVNELHRRAKANAAAARCTRPAFQQDANLAVDAIAFLLQDFGWAEVT
jgi:hypothetical protein